MRAFVDSLALIEQASKANTEAQQKADEQVMSMVKSMRTLDKTIKVSGQNGRTINKVNMTFTEHMIKQKEAMEKLVEEQKNYLVGSDQYKKVTKKNEFGDKENR